MHSGLSTHAVVFDRPGALSLRDLELSAPAAGDLLVDIECAGISSGTEKLLWDGTMPAFPGLAYPLVPGYEAVGVVRTAGTDCSLKTGDRVFVPGAACYKGDVRGLFGATAATLVVPEARVAPVAELAANKATLLALAATAMHILTHDLRRRQSAESSNKSSAQPSTESSTKPLNISELAAHAPQLIVGHGVLGRLLARICLAIGADAPLVWELDEQRQQGATGYEVASPADDDGAARQRIVDVSGSCGNHFNKLIGQLGKGGSLTLAGFYQEPVNFNFAPAFMREISVSIAAEWVPDDLSMVLALVQANALDLDGLITHEYPITKAEDAYPTAFNDPGCLKMILDWSA